MDFKLKKKGGRKRKKQQLKGIKLTILILILSRCWSHFFLFGALSIDDENDLRHVTHGKRKSRKKNFFIFNGQEIPNLHGNPFVEDVKSYFIHDIR